MGRGIGFISLLLAVGVGAYLYLQQASSISPDAGAPTTLIDVTGVRADLLALANAERAHLGCEWDLRVTGSTTRRA